MLLGAAPSVRAQESTMSPPSAAASLDDANARRVLVLLAEHGRSSRVANAYSMFIGGAAAITAGIVADSVYDRSYGRPLWIIGALAEVGGVLNLFVPSMYERMAHEAEQLSADQLQKQWLQRALAARSARRIGGVVGLGLGVVSIAGGAAVAAGLGEMERATKQDWTTVLSVFGGALMGQGLVSLLVESPFETSYRTAYGRDLAAHEALSLNIAPTVGGASVSLRSTF
jgi:hypothetical protein